MRQYQEGTIIASAVRKQLSKDRLC